MEVLPLVVFQKRSVYGSFKSVELGPIVIPDVVSMHLLHNPSKERVMPLTAPNVQFPDVHAVAETERLVEGLVRPLMMFISTVGSISKKVPESICGSCAVVFADTE